MALPYELVGEADWTEATTLLAKIKKPRSRNDGTLDRAIESAAAYAAKTGSTMWVYCGNSYMNKVWLVVKTANKTCGMDSTDANVASVSLPVRSSVTAVKRCSL